MSEKGITVLSLFDGMSCGQIALREAGIKVNKYFASEIDKHVIAQTLHNFPDTVQQGSVTEVHAADLPHIDLLIGGSHCQGFSFAGKQLNFNDPRSVLFFEYVRILREIQEYNPGVLFLLENVRMRRECEQVITEHLGLEPVVINSALVSAQNRVRLYWTNIKTREEVNLFDTKVFTAIPQPEDRGIFIRDILEEEVESRFYLTPARVKKLIEYDQRQKDTGNGFGFDPREEDQKAKAVCVGGKRHDDIVKLSPERVARCVAIRGRFNPETGRNEQTAEFRPDGKTNCLTSVEKDNLIYEVACLTPRRTEYGKAIRRQYEAGEIQESRHNMTELEPRTDGKTNTLTTVQKDNIIVQHPHGYNAGAVFHDKAPTVTSSRYEANNTVVTREIITDTPELDIEPGTLRTHKVDGGFRPIKSGKAGCLCARARNDGSGQGVLRIGDTFRRLTPTECSRLQTVPDWYEWACSETQAYRMLGNGWTVEVIKHIFQFINTEKL